MKTIICGMLEENENVFFLIKKNKLELPHIFATTKADPIGQLAEAFKKQTDIKVQVGEMIIQTKCKVASEEMSLIVFKMIKLGETKSHHEHIWLPLAKAKQKELAESTSWLEVIE